MLGARFTAQRECLQVASDEKRKKRGGKVGAWDEQVLLMHTISESPFDGYLHVSSTANITALQLGSSLSAHGKVFRGVQDKKQFS